ncbi:MAG: DUF4350 domain-containing protein [Halolamina sp.]
MNRADLGRRVAFAAGIAVLVVVAAVGLPQLLAPSGPAEPVTVDTSEWDGSMAVEPLDSQGEVSPDVPDGDDRTVVIDASHNNRLDDGDVQPLVRTLRRNNYTVRFSADSNLTRVLADADAFVIVDPGTPYSREETDTLQNFTDDGGRLLVLAEPNRKKVEVGQFGSASIVTTKSYVDGLLGSYNVFVDWRYVYNQEVNDGNYQDVVADAGAGADLENGEYALFVAAPVYAPNAEPLLVLPESSRLARTDAPNDYAVAVRQDNLIVVGDSSFLSAGQQNVGDNERFVAYLIEFLVSGERTDTETEGTDTGNSSLGAPPVGPA